MPDRVGCVGWWSVSLRESRLLKWTIRTQGIGPWLAAAVLCCGTSWAAGQETDGGEAATAPAGVKAVLLVQEAASAGGGAVVDGPLVNATFQPMQDTMGFAWDPQPNGTINDGSNDAFDGAATLLLNGQQFSGGGGSQRQMTQDGQEYVLSQTFANNLLVTRRLRLDASRGAVRYLETVRNTGNAPQQVALMVVTNFGSTAQRVLLGTQPAPEGQEVTSHSPNLAAFQQGSRPSVLMVIVGGQAQALPKVRVQNRRTVQVSYAFEVPPGEERSVLHFLTQRRFAGADPSEEAAEAEEAFIGRRGQPVNPLLPETMDPDQIVNFRFTQEAPVEGEPLLRLANEQAETMGVERDDSLEHAVLLVSEEVQLTGTLHGEPITMATEHAEATLPVDWLAMLVGGGGIGLPSQAYLRDGQVLVGPASAPAFNLTVENGAEMPLVPASLAAVVAPPNEQLDNRVDAEALWMVRTVRGNRLLTTSDPPAVRVATLWGSMTFDAEEVAEVVRVAEPTPGHRVYLRDGSVVVGVLHGPPVTLETPLLGRVAFPPVMLDHLVRVQRLEPAPSEDSPPPDQQQVVGDLIRNVLSQFRPAGAEAEEPAPAPDPAFTLVGGTTLRGTIDLPPDTPLTVRTLYGSTDVDIDEIVSLEQERTDTGSTTCTITRTGDADAVEGTLTLATLPIRCGERVWRVPTEHVLHYAADGSAPASATAPMTPLVK